MKYLLLVVSMVFIFSSNVYAGRMTDEWKLTIKKDYAGVITKLKDKSGKTAEAYYLLGKAYYEKGDNIKAAEAWKETLTMAGKNKSKSKWDFLWPPKSLRTKKLTGKKKKKIYKKFKSQFEEVKGAAQSELKKSAKANARKADAKRIDAKRNQAKAKKATAKANAKSEAIKDKHKVADRKLKVAQTKANMAKNRRGNRGRVSGTGSSLGAIIIGLIFFAIVIFIIIKANSSRGSGAPMRSRRRVGRYDVYYDDGIFDMGPFWYDGVYFRNERDYYNQYGSHYTNRMYTDGYDEYADQYEQEAMQDLDEVDRMNDEILDDVDDREKLRNEAADANYDADMDNADADEYDNDSRYDNEDSAEYDEASDAFDDEPEFEDEEDEEDEDW